MSKKETKKQDEFASVEQALSTSEAFIEKHQKQLLIGVGVIVLLVLVVLSINNFYLKPRELNAEKEIYQAQNHFANDAYELALNGDEVNFLGFKDIADQYNRTATGNLAKAYAGICYYQMKQYDNAIEYLSSFKGNDNYFSVSTTGLIGDSYVELGDKNKALSYFEKAGFSKNKIMSPVYLKKAGLIYESLNQNEKALKVYTTIKESYSTSQEAADIDKYIARTQK